MGFEDELLKDAEDSLREVEFIRNNLPQELKEKFSDDELYYFLDVIMECYMESDILDDATPDKDGYVEIDLDRVVDYVIQKAKKEQMGEYEHDDILFIVQAESDYSEQLDEEDN